MSTSFTLFEDANIKIETVETSSRFDLSINFKSKGEFPIAFMQLRNDETMSAGQLSSVGLAALYAAFLHMSDDMVEHVKKEVAKL